MALRLFMLENSLAGLFRSSEKKCLPSISICRRRGTRVKKFPLIEHLREEMAMKRISGVSDCPKNCLCSQKVEITYKNVRLLSQFTSHQTGCILPRSITKVCMKKQKKIAKEVKRARIMGFLPYTESLEEYLKDPRLFNLSRSRSEKLLQAQKEQQQHQTTAFNFSN